jgi:four helix bundle protein
LIRESQNAESKAADFIHKLAVAQKECDESIYWIELLCHTEYLSSTEFESINNEAIEILKIIRSIIITSKNK